VPARSKARKRALDVLFEAEVRGEPVLDLLEQRIIEASPPVSEYAAELVRGVSVHWARIDELIAEYAQGWTLERMPAVDRNILRLAIYEMLYERDTPKLVVVDEAIELAKKFGSEQSGRFINGLLDGLLKQHTFPGTLT